MGNVVAAIKEKQEGIVFRNRINKTRGRIKTWEYHF